MSARGGGKGLGVRSCAYICSRPQAPLPDDLDPLLGKRFRKIGRFIKLGLAGAMRAVERSGLARLPADRTGVFLGTGLGNLPELLEFSEAILSQGETFPSPIQFANSVGNSGAFYIAQALELTGPVLAVTQDEVSFEAALLSARALLDAGEVDFALVGGADVNTPDAPAQRVRMGYAADAPMALGEGTGWLLVERLSEGSIAVLEHASIEGVSAPRDIGRLLGAHGAGAVALGARLGERAQEWVAALPQGSTLWSRPSGAFPSESCVPPAAFLEESGGRVLHSIHATREGHLGCVTLRRLRAPVRERRGA